MYQFLLTLHSIFRYIVLIFILFAFIQSLTGWLSKNPYTKTNRVVNLLALISAHTQFLIGLVLYFYSPNVMYDNMGVAMKDPALRYWTVEHLAMMLFAVILITIGHSRSKKIVLDAGRHRTVAIFYGLALLIIVVVILQSGRPLLGMSV